MKSIESVNNTISSNLKLDKKAVTLINRFYWKEVRTKMQNLEDTAVCMKGFATFSISKYLIREKIFDIIQKIRGFRKSKRFTENVRNIIVEKHYVFLRQLLKQRNKVAIDYYERFNRLLETDTESTEEC